MKHVWLSQDYDLTEVLAFGSKKKAKIYFEKVLGHKVVDGGNEAIVNPGDQGSYDYIIYKKEVA